MSNKVSVILPTYNEAEHIVELVHNVIGNIPQGWVYEVIVVDDNSPDHTHQVVENAFKDNPAVIPILRTSDRGLAKSIRCGIERAGGDRVVVMDSDFTHDPVEIPKLLHVSAVYDIVSGSRFCAGGRMQDTAHYLASMVYNWFLRLVLRTQVQDNLGGYFAARKQDIMSLPVERIFFGYGDYFFRLLHFAQLSKLSIVEVPAQYMMRFRGMSKSNYLKMIYTYTSAALRLKYEIYRLEKGGRNLPK